MAALRVVVISYPVALLIIVAAVPFVSGQVTWQTVVFGTTSGVAQGFAVWWFYEALAKGPMSVVSPLTAVLVAAIPVVVGFGYGERPTTVALCGIGLALLAVILVSKPSPDDDALVGHPRFTLSVALFTVGSGLAFALSFVLLHKVDSESGLWPLVFGRSAALLVVFVAAAFSGNLVISAEGNLKFGIIVGLLDVAANVTMLYALQQNLLSLASVLISLYPAATVLLAMTVLGERANRRQKMGMALALTAVVLIALP
ncbi:MAG: EamA family transporter [Mycobacteriaceae bacterium]